MHNSIYFGGMGHHRVNTNGGRPRINNHPLNQIEINISMCWMLLAARFWNRLRGPRRIGDSASLSKLGAHKQHKQIDLRWCSLHPQTKNHKYSYLCAHCGTPNCALRLELPMPWPWNLHPPFFRVSCRASTKKGGAWKTRFSKAGNS